MLNGQVEEVKKHLASAEFASKSFYDNAMLFIAFIFGAIFNICASIVYDLWIKGNYVVEIQILVSTAVGMVAFVVALVFLRISFNHNLKKAEGILKTVK